MNIRRSEPAAAPVDQPVGSARTPSVWTPEREARALRLYLEEGFTAADVADALGADISRAAVTGKIRRLGFLKREARVAGSLPLVRGPRVRRPKLERRLPPQHPPQPLPPLREVGAIGVPTPLAGLSACACRWPIDDPGPGRMHLALFCAGLATRGVYCEAHWTLAHDRSPTEPASPEAASPELASSEPAPRPRPEPHAEATPLARAA